MTITAITTTIRPRIASLAERHWLITLTDDPVFATQVGDARFADQLPDLRPAARDDVMRAFQRSLNEARALREGPLTPLERRTLDVIEAHARTQVQRRLLGHDLIETVDQLSGPSTLLDQLLEVQPLETDDQVEDFLRRLERVPRYLDGVLLLMREGVQRGRVPADIVIGRVLRQVEAMLDRRPEAWRAAGATPPGMRDRAIRVLRDRVVPAYAAYRDALTAMRSRARRDIGLGWLPDGDALYASRILAWTSLELPPRAVHAAGLDELAAVRAEQREVARRLGHGSVPEATDEAAERSRSRDRAEVVAEAERLVALGWEASADWMTRRPRSTCRVVPIDPGREGDILDYYVQPSADGRRPGTFHVSTRPGRTLYGLASTAFHEASPGHHLQTAVEQEAPNRPAVLRFAADLVGGALCEGWGLYAERLADEMGLYEDDARRLGMLELQALRAARMVVDTGIHAMGWTRERAINFLRDTWTDSPRDVAIEVDRYVATPGQALAYMVGMREIRRWRERAVPSGDHDALVRFHDRLLDLGSMPLPTIERELEVTDDTHRP